MGSGMRESKPSIPRTRQERRGVCVCGVCVSGAKTFWDMVCIWYRRARGALRRLHETTDVVTLPQPCIHSFNRLS